MSDERPVRLQISTCAAKQSNVNKVCIVHDETLHTDSVTVGSLSSHSFEQIRNAVSVRRRHSVGSHLNIICEQVPTTFVPDIHGVQPCTLLVISPDTDVFVLLLYYVHQVSGRLLFETGTGSHRRRMHVPTVASAIGSRMCMALPALHSFTGCDTTSAFVRKGKRKGFDLLESALRNDGRSSASKVNILSCLSAFESLGSVEATVSDDQLHALERFVCMLYGKPTCTDVNKARYSIFSSRYQQRTLSVAAQYGIDLSLLPPCLDSLKMHCARSAFQAFIWRHAHDSIQNMPTPSGHGWKFTDNELQVDWFSGDMLPHDVIDLMADRSPSEEDVNDDVDLQFHVGMSEDVEEDDVVDSIVDVIFDEDDDEEGTGEMK